MQTLYDILQVSRSASTEVIGASHRTLARRYHPDNQATGDAARFKEIQTAWEMLKDAKLRRQYDAEMRKAETAEVDARHQSRRPRRPGPEAVPDPPAGPAIDRLAVDAASNLLMERFGHIPGVSEFVQAYQEPAAAALRHCLGIAETRARRRRAG